MKWNNIAKHGKHYWTWQTLLPNRHVGKECYVWFKLFLLSCELKRNIHLDLKRMCCKCDFFVCVLFAILSICIINCMNESWLVDVINLVIILLSEGFYVVFVFYFILQFKHATLCLSNQCQTMWKVQIYFDK